MVSLEVNAGLQFQFFCLLDGRGVEPVKWRKLQTQVVFYLPTLAPFPSPLPVSVPTATASGDWPKWASKECGRLPSSPGPAFSDALSRNVQGSLIGLWSTPWPTSLSLLSAWSLFTSFQLFQCALGAGLWLMRDVFELKEIISSPLPHFSYFCVPDFAGTVTNNYPREVGIAITPGSHMEGKRTKL